MYKNFILILILPAFLISQEIPDQKDIGYIKSRYGFEVARQPVVNFNSYSDIYGDSVFIISVSVQNDYLQFTKKDDIFFAQYEIIASVRKENDKPIISDVWQENVKVVDFDETNSKELFQKSIHSIPFTKETIDQIKEKKIFLIIELRDLLSSRIYKAKRKLSIPSEKDFSNIMFLESKQSDSGIISSDKILHFNKPYYINGYFLNGTNWQSKDRFSARLFKQESGENVLIKQAFVDGNTVSKNIISFSYNLPYELLEEGDYILRITFDNKDNVNSLEEKFKVIWFEKPTYLYKTDLAIRPMKYLLSPEQMEYVKELDLDQLDEWFSEFWKEKDPSEGTTYNELMNEFFSRVSYTVRKFSTRFKEGWQTDQGMVYILYGEPGKIENKKYRSDMPYIVWTYGNNSDKTIFTFVDDDLNGEFTLVTDENGE